MESVRVAAAQVTPVFLNRDATVAKACEVIREAAAGGARLVVFPEALIPTYPDWVWRIAPSHGGGLNDLYAELVANSVDIPSPATDELCNAARESAIHVVMGLNERNAEASGGSLYNTLLYIDGTGRILGRHRKLIPTSAERMVWAGGDGSTLEVYDTPYGRLGGLICWENYMPLARYSMYAWGTQIYVAPTWASGEVWTLTLRHIAMEGQVYVIGCCIPMRKSDIPDGLQERFYADVGAWVNPGGSAIIAPGGNVLAGPVNEREEILYAEIDVRKTMSGRRSLDVAGHYARPDVFDLRVQRDRRPVVRCHATPESRISAEAADSRPPSKEHIQQRGARGVAGAAE